MTSTMDRWTILREVSLFHEKQLCKVLENVIS